MNIKSSYPRIYVPSLVGDGTNWEVMKGSEMTSSKKRKKEKLNFKLLWSSFSQRLSPVR